MAIYQFKSNINCNNCKMSVSRFLENREDIIMWEVDLEDKDKILTVETKGTPEDLIELIKTAGYQAELIPD